MKKISTKMSPKFGDFCHSFWMILFRFLKKRLKSKVNTRDTTLGYGHYGAHAHNHIMAAMESCLDAQVTQSKVSQYLIFLRRKLTCEYVQMRLFNREPASTSFGSIWQRDRISSSYSFFLQFLPQENSQHEVPTLWKAWQMLGCLWVRDSVTN